MITILIRPSVSFAGCLVLLALSPIGLVDSAQVQTNPQPDNPVGTFLPAETGFAAPGDVDTRPLSVGSQADAARTSLSQAPWLDVVEDRTIGIRSQEADAYYRLLKHAQQLDPERLRQAALEFHEQRRRARPGLAGDSKGSFPTFIDLFQHPDLYRGEPVTMQGHIRRLIKTPASENDYGISTLYEAWFYTPDSQSNPAVVVCTSIPQGIPIGGDILEQVSITGYFFKMYGYEAQDGTRVAPLILADRLVWLRPEVVPGVSRIAVAVGVILAALLVMALLYRLAKADRRPRPSADASDLSFLSEMPDP